MHGLIISTGTSDSGPYRYKVLELDVCEGLDPHVVRFIHESAFQVPSGVMEMVERKNLQRRLDMPLLFGDIISWTERDILDTEEKPITGFKRDKALYQARATGHGCELLLRGAINPDDRMHIRTNMFKKLRIPVHLMQIGIPNVYFNCWVEIKPSYDTCDVTLTEFHSICELAVQEELITLPWNINNDAYRTHISLDSDSDDGHPWLIEDTYKGPRQELFGRGAFVSGARTFFCGEHSDKMFLIPILKRNDLAAKLGTQLTVDAIYNRFEDCYLVSKVHTPVSVMSFPTDDEGRLRCSVHLTHIPGVFFNRELGFMDDPDGKLALLHITKYATSAVQVAVVDNGPSQSAKGRFRFRIIDLVATLKESKIQKWLDRCLEDNVPIVLSDETGAVVSQTHVFCPKHATLLFRLPRDMEVMPGKLVKFTAQYSFEKDEFLISSMVYLPNIALNYVVRRMFEHSPYEQQYIFQITKARLPDRDDIPPLLCCDHFGYIDDLGLIKDIQKNKQYSVWVMLSAPDFKDAYRPARVSWEVVSATSKEPADRVTAQCGGRILDKVHGELLESGSESCFSNWSDPLTAYSEQKQPSVYRREFTDDGSTLGEQLSEDRRSQLGGGMVSTSPGGPEVTRVHPSGLPAASGRYRTISGGSNMTVGDSETCSNYRQSACNDADEDADSVVPVSAKRKISVQLVIDQINRFAHDDACGERCVYGCPFLKALSNHIVKTPNFWTECAQFPELAASVLKKMEYK